jgi:NAD(P)-dependent dehydrogenase (short-subunit alcohol dehydrogenase family)
MAENRVSIVVGSARGIGLAIAQALARRGDRPVLADVLFSDAAIRSRVSADVGGNVTLQETDIASADAVAALIDETLRRYGRIDCLVNAVGINRPAPFYETSEADWERMIAVNLKGAFLLSQAVAKPMMKQRSGRIVHIGSTASHTGAPGLAPYAATTHGLVGLVRGMACDLAPFGITVNAVCPGNTDTEMLQAVVQQRARHQGRTPEDVLDEIAKKTPLGRLGRPSDVAAAVVFFTSEEAGYITGQSLIVDGGRSINLI